MLSEFEVSKPNRNFSQLHLEYYELTFLNIKANLIVENCKIIGKLHLNSRSIIFEPQDLELPLIRFKYCDALKLKVTHDLPLKNFLKIYSNQASSVSLNKGESTLAKVFFKEKNRDKLVKIGSNPTSKAKMELTQLTIKKFIVIDRNPPAPYSLERCDREILIEMEEDQEKTDLFKRFYDDVVQTKEDEDLHKSLVEKLVNRAMKKHIAESKDKIVYYVACKMQQLFECFYGFMVVKATKVIEFIPIVNVTKDVELKIPIREIKYVNDHRHMFKPLGLEIFLYNTSESYLFIFQDQNSKDTIKEILTSNAPKILELHLDMLTKMWMNGVLSNFDYLMYLNRFSSRSFNDISQYPIFPWIINEFSDDGRL